MELFVELSGLGHYGVCTIVPPDLLRALRDMIENSAHAAKFKSSISETGPFGVDEALRPNFYGDKEEALKVIWIPGKLEGAMLSHEILRQCASLLEPQSPLPVDDKTLTLEVAVGRSGSDGWYVHARFSAPVWDVIEGPFFPEILPHINREIRDWWEDYNGWRGKRECTTLFKGRDGPTLQIYQSSGNGLWIAGSRKDRELGQEFQFYDHNTDYHAQAFAHIIGLCFVLKHCRQSVGA